MLQKRQPISVETAVDRVMAAGNSALTETEWIEITESYGRIIAEDITATHPVPPFSKSPYDGFALRASDTEGASDESPITFKVIEHIGAGTIADKKLEKNQAIRIMTGAQIPEGADCVAMFEVCTVFREGDDEKIVLRENLETGENIVEIGSETEKGSHLVSRGEKINPGIQALLATFGYQRVKVKKKPVVGIFATGSELLDINQPLEPGKIRNSNAFMIAAQVERAGGKPLYLGKLADELEVSFSSIKKALEKVDLLITTGGVSVGDFDLLPEIYNKLEAKVLFNKVSMRPGSVTTVASKGGKLLFGLSGNPSACYVGFELFTRPYIQKMLEMNKFFLSFVEAELDAAFPKPNPFSRFVRSKIYFQDGRVKVVPVGIDKSAVVTSLADTTALMMLPGGTKGFYRNDKVTVLLLENNEGSTRFIEPSLLNEEI